MAENPAVCVYQFKVVLRGVSPMIWRRLLLRSDQTIADLHYSIQLAMGCSDSHLNRFHIHGKDYGVAHEGGVMFSDDPEKVHLGDCGFRRRERFLYEYLIQLPDRHLLQTTLAAAVRRAHDQFREDPEELPGPEAE